MQPATQVAKTLPA